MRITSSPLQRRPERKPLQRQPESKPSPSRHADPKARHRKKRESPHAAKKAPHEIRNVEIS
jgi:hypothetical protein